MAIAYKTEGHLRLGKDGTSIVVWVKDSGNVTIHQNRQAITLTYAELDALHDCAGQILEDILV